MPVESDLIPNEHAELQREADAVLLELRPALARILERIQPPVMRATDLRRRLHLSQKVSWCVFGAATARDARALASLLPGRRAMETFFAASELQGVPREIVARARAAFDGFEESVARHAGSRDAFETMVSEFGVGNSVLASTDLKHRRAAFRAMSLLWGRQVRVCFGTRILHPGTRPGMLDNVLIRGMAGLQRTRRAVPLHTVTQLWHTATPGDLLERVAPEPLDPRETGPESIGLLRDFCSQPLPEFRPRVSRPGYRSYELVGDRLGPSGEVSYVMGQLMRDDTVVPGSVPGSAAILSKAVDIPIELLISDILISKSVWDTRAPQVEVYAFPLDGSMEPRDLLPQTEKAEYLGEGIEVAHTPFIPRYAEMLSYAMERTGWKEEEFRVFRCRVDCPVLYSWIRMALR